MASNQLTADRSGITEAIVDYSKWLSDHGGMCTLWIAVPYDCRAWRSVITVWPYAGYCRATPPEHEKQI